MKNIRQLTFIALFILPLTVMADMLPTFFSTSTKYISGPWGKDYDVFISYSAFPSKDGPGYGASASYKSKNPMSSSKGPECRRPVWKAGGKVINSHGQRRNMAELVMYLVDFSDKDFSRLSGPEIITLDWCGQTIPLTASDKKEIAEMISKAKDSVW